MLTLTYMLSPSFAQYCTPSFVTSTLISSRKVAKKLVSVVHLTQTHQTLKHWRELVSNTVLFYIRSRTRAEP